MNANNTKSTVNKVISEIGNDITKYQALSSQDIVKYLYNPNIEDDIQNKNLSFQNSVKDLTNLVFKELTENDAVSEIFNILVTIEHNSNIENFVMMSLLSYSYKYTN